MAIQQILFIITLVLGGGYAGSWFRKFEMSGFELWFPMGFLVAYAYSPPIGFLVGFSIMFFTFLLFPYGLHHLVISAVSMGAIFYIAGVFFPIDLAITTAATFLKTSMLLAVTFQIVSNIFYFLTGYPIFRILKFVMVNLFLSFLIFSRFGLSLIEWL